MHPTSGIDLHQVQVFGSSLAMGLLIGLERERRPSARAGVRTFALTALLGTLLAMLGEIAGSSWLPAAGLVAVSAMIIAAYHLQPDESDPGTTSVVALLVCYCLGALAWFGYTQLALTLCIGTTVLLYFKTELEGISQRLTPADLISILQFSVLSFVILPVLPDRDFGPFNALNLRQVWLMVVLVSGMSLAGYAALRLIGPRLGLAVVAVFGGLVSSTATTLVFARHARQDASHAPTAAVVILLANLTMMTRVLAIAAVIAPSVIPRLALATVPGMLLGLTVTLLLWRRLQDGGELPLPAVRNPTELPMALGFGALYAAVLLCAAWLSSELGSRGVYALALVSGATDLDAIVLSSLRLLGQGSLGAEAVVTAIVLAMLASLAFKLGLSVAIAGRPLVRQILAGMLVIGVGIGAGLLALATV